MNMFNIWQSIGIAISIPAFTQVISGPLNQVFITQLIVGMLFMFGGVVSNALNNKEQSLWIKFCPLLIDIGANLLAAGLNIPPSYEKVLFLISGVILIELYCLAILTEKK